MDFEFSEEQNMLRKFARDFLVDKCTKEYVREMEADEQGYSNDIWKEMAELGWMGLVFPEKYNGGDMSFFELTVLLEEMGRACLPGPFFSTVVLGGMAILDAGTEEQKNEFLPKIASGKMIMALALTEPDGTYTPQGISVTAVQEGNDYIINGTKLFVADADIADYFLCAVRTKPGTSADGISLFLVDAKNSGISKTSLQTIAADKQSEVVFNNVRVPKENMLGQLDSAWPTIERLMERAAVGKCAEMIGGAQQVLESTIEYAKDRHQFGRPIGSFQAVQHHCANMATDVEGSKFITYQAAWTISEGLPAQKEAAMAKAWVSKADQRVILLGHQIHGAIGFTQDYDLQLYFRRAKAAQLVFGNSDFHLEKVASHSGI